VSQGNIRKDNWTCGLPGGNVEYIQRSFSEALKRRNNLLDKDVNGE
jgi:hypothetical protein